MTRLRSSARDALDETKANVDEFVQDRVDPVLTDAQARTDALLSAAVSKSGRPSPSEVRELAETFRVFASQTVQPLSRQLVRDEVAAQAPNVAAVVRAKPAKLRPLKLMSAASLVSPFSPVITTALVVVSALSAAIIANGTVLGLFGLAVAGVVNCTLLFILRWGFPRASRFLPTPIRIGAWLILLASSALVAGLAEAYIWSSDPTVSSLRLALGSWVVAQLAAGILLGLAGAAFDHFARDTRGAAAAVATYELELSGLEQAQSAIRHRAGITLHGSVQGTLVSNALRLELLADVMAANSRAEQTGLVLNQVHRDLERAREVVTVLTTATTQDQLDESLTAIANAWRGLVLVHLDIRTSRERTAALTYVIIEIVREAIINAAKHGTASDVGVVVMSDTGSVIVQVTDNGIGPAAATKPGAGFSAVLAEASTYELIPAPRHGAQLNVRIPYP